MQCGHQANAVNAKGEPSCVICLGIHPGAQTIAKAQPDLEGRKARCSCGQTAPSTLSGRLAFFEFRGEGSVAALNYCGKCGYTDAAHAKEVRPSKVCESFVARGPLEYDSFYCGHAGWD